ncbi:ABC transporter ATP-binding protein [Nocardioides dubius]|uniref:ABC transporter ATP-binding protein n=1 Tax=Nocardioides dubius TaxID=317019 RepID=A0ABN1TUN8_9ACTN
MSSRDLLPTASGRDTAQYAWRLLRQRRLPLIGASASFVVVGLCALVPPFMLGRIVDGIDEPGTSLTAPVLAIVASAVVGAIFTYCSVALLARVGEPALAELREEVLDKSLHLDAGRVEAAGVGDVLARVGDDARTVASSLSEAIPLLINSLVLVTFTVAGLLALDWRLGLAGLLAAPSYLAGLRWYLPRSGPMYRAERIAVGERAEALVSGIRGAGTLRALGHQEPQLAAIEERSTAAMSISVGVFAMLTRFGARSNRSELIGLLAVLGVGFWLVREDAVTVGAVTTAALFFHRLFNPIGALLYLFDELQSTGASLSRLVGVTQLPGTTATTAAPPAPGPLRLDDVAHRYVADRTALAPVSLEIAPGERIAVVGATGAGKSTLGAIAGGVLTPSSGEVTLAGESYQDLRGPALRSRVALVSQDVHVFSGTVRDALTLGDPGADDVRLTEALARVRATGWVAALPDGLDTAVGDGAHPLTPAQAQQLALARVWLADPWFVVLDEATAEAGSAGARDLELASLAITEGRGALVVAHRLTQSATADRVLVMQGGEIVEAGTHEELIARQGHYAELWSAWRSSSSM